MRIEASLFAALGRPAAGASAVGFAELLGAEPAAAVPLLAQGQDGAVGGSGRGAREPQAGPAAQAFAFGAFGLFGPGGGAAPGSGAVLQSAGEPPGDLEAAPAAPAFGRSSSAGLPGPASADAAAASPGRADPLGRPNQAGAGVRAGRAGGAAAPGPTARAAALEEPEPGDRGASAPPARVAAGRTSPARLQIVDADGRLTVVARAWFDGEGADAVRARLRAAAADRGVRLDDIVINGDAGASPARGARHGHRAR